MFSSLLTSREDLFEPLSLLSPRAGDELFLLYLEVSPNVSIDATSATASGKGCRPESAGNRDRPRGLVFPSPKYPW